MLSRIKIFIDRRRYYLNFMKLHQPRSFPVAGAGAPVQKVYLCAFRFASFPCSFSFPCILKNLSISLETRRVQSCTSEANRVSLLRANRSVSNAVFQHIVVNNCGNGIGGRTPTRSEIIPYAVT